MMDYKTLTKHLKKYLPKPEIEIMQKTREILQKDHTKEWAKELQKEILPKELRTILDTYYASLSPPLQEKYQEGLTLEDMKEIKLSKR